MTGALLRALAALILALAALAPAHAQPEGRGRRRMPHIHDEPGVAQLAALMAKGEVTSAALVQEYLDFILTHDPKLKSVIETNPDALALAEALDQERKAKGPRGPLHGVPVLIKDNIATKDRMQTTAGSLALVGVKPPKDAFVVERLRKAGAVLLGKTNLSEWANIRSTRSTSGWSARGGLVRNPYALDRSACGSSSGTGAAIAANLATVGVGTETDGSIVCPSGSNALVGLKPTVGLVSRAGIIPISHTQDTAGPMTRTVADAAALLNALAGVDPQDPATAAARGKIEADYTKFLDANALQGARIGVPRKGFAGRNPIADRVLAESLAALKKAGAVLVDPADIPHLDEAGEAELEVLLHELKAGMDAYLPKWAPGGPRSLADLIAFNDKNAGKELPFFGQELFLRAQATQGLESQKYKDALAKCQSLGKGGLEEAFAKHKVDALIAITNAPAWTIDLVNGDHFSFGSSEPAAIAGTPAITVPAGWERGLPVGLTFMGKAFGEGKLLGLAHAFEQATRARKRPTFPATLDLGSP